MGWLDFIVSMVKSIAWPSVAMVALLVFKDPLKKRLASLKAVSVTKDGVITEFEAALEETSRDIAKVKLESIPNLAPIPLEQFERDDQIKGNAARIAAAWQELETIIRRKLVGRGVDTDRLSLADILDTAFQQNLITSAERRSLWGLNKMRNLAVHDREILRTPDDERTQEFLTLVDSMKFVIENKI